ncbi:GrpB family protein [Dysgonomonas macrotermitis]|uniref:GrpB domain, predicted nucleotidyltransferase, UPF0157 family n=1 Tax=Dysgonomonas macrotermitis TaxID=1346286 RepID=A0A1M4THJ8_9BACT|nr:GrpB family protein [Dysgonomonas macrotermitis]SHE43757.1 GrpB domain, predicted nucleotidyltransferase, UPF0157 family [Dysgonomonas macrotermitis]
MKKLTELTNEELWQLFPIIVSEHKNYWKDNYTEESQKLTDIIGRTHIERINHIGSTAVEGLLAKPTIDILLEITGETDLIHFRKIIEDAGYIYSRQPDNPPPHMMFMKGYTPNGFEGQVFHLHVRYKGDWDELYFRDYLIKHPDIAANYGQLKLELKDQFEHNRDAYTYAKTDFVNRYTKLGREEFSNRYKE